MAASISIIGCLAVLGCLLASPALAQTGIASIYWEGSVLASGAPFHPNDVLCAHRTIALGATIRVTDLDTGHSILCPVLDRGPFVAGRIVDLSLGAARALGVSVAQGLARVSVEVVQ